MYSPLEQNMAAGRLQHWTWSFGKGKNRYHYGRKRPNIWESLLAHEILHDLFGDMYP
jgi:hypothetical protein